MMIAATATAMATAVLIYAPLKREEITQLRVKTAAITNEGVTKNGDNVANENGNDNDDDGEISIS
ncbi:hypothetical protein, unlikely [Trypanosoma brucei brucei TREU927]|uniref:Uncharacterized protein n=2 Tax=Trypanosoma brucei TaxID=5691 RepID=Q4GZ75_TRYB2|nr:hypothetical protein, unlikely [Trypanosoma brucei brucei TREU927]RHW74306.1 hypothetical protein DPX39_010017700 [Trypanosoma brucei equiperdum]CAJ16114.1 hypothetical protein, unlikely [Trypanosoma brucei brucei TREU927]